MTVKELFDIFESSYMRLKLKPTTVNGYLVNINNHILPYIGDKELSEIDFLCLDRLTAVLVSKNLNGTTIHYVYAVMKKAFSFAVKRRYIEYNIIQDFDLPRKNEFNYSTYTEDELIKIISYLRLTDNDIFPAVLLAGCFGLRRGECLGIKTSDIGQNSVAVRQSSTYLNHEMISTDCKTKLSKREILLSDDVVSALTEYDRRRAENSEGWFLRIRNGKRISSNSLNNRFNRVQRKLSLPHIRFHDLRHTYATVMMKNGINPKIVSRILGHSSVGITLDLYSHYDIDMQRPALAEITDKVCKKAL